MKRIGIISDTHSYWDERYLTYFDECDEIWHAGDIGTTEIVDRLAAPFGSADNTKRRIVRAVKGNADGGDLLRMFPEVLRFKCEDVEVLL